MVENLLENLEQQSMELRKEAEIALYNLFDSGIYNYIVLDLKEKNIFGSDHMVNTDGFECVEMSQIKNNQEEIEKWIKRFEESIARGHKY